MKYISDEIKSSLKALEELESIIEYRFDDLDLLKKALTHSSVSRGTIDFERFEFLGDRILNLQIAKTLFEKNPQMTEGELAPKLAHLISRETLYKIAKKIHLKKFAIFRASNHSEENLKKIFADIIEAIIAAIFLDKGQSAANKFIDTHWQEFFSDEISNPRSELQELLHKYNLENPKYETTQVGEIFVSHITIEINNKQFSATAKGKSIKDSSKAVAKKTLEIIKKSLNQN